ncbi:unnamed protein product [Staurois parvus]|uniref:Uncharacterized protein n=1 Tax=Staurois parvus TaxID=386267 RepID=A0ABN9HN28_9NEOB|nr:unnamed protein product [Staurois parvus]
MMCCVYFTRETCCLYFSAVQRNTKQHVLAGRRKTCVHTLFSPSVGNAL